MRPQQRYLRRLIMGMGFLVLCSLLLWALSLFVIYFKTGAEPAGIHTSSIVLDNFHTPLVEWSINTPSANQAIDSFTLSGISDAYIESWNRINQAMHLRNAEVLKGFLVPEQIRHLEASFPDPDIEYGQVDLEHHLIINHFSKDKQLIAFRDKGVRIIKEANDLQTGLRIYRTDQVMDYDIVMTLDDGRWRIRHMVKRNSAKALAEIPKFSRDNDMSIVQGKTFYLKGNAFKPRGVNYYPAKYPWKDLWTKFDSVDLDRDFELIRDLNLNCIRIFLPFEVFGAGKVKQEMLDKLDELLNKAAEYNLMVIVCLFDFPIGYELKHYPATEQHLTQILENFSGNKQILAWDLKNEPDLDFGIHGKAIVLDWLEFIANRAKSFAPEDLITTGWSHPEHVVLLADKLDFISFHYYEKASELALYLDQIPQDINKPMVLSEFGLSSFKAWWWPFSKSESAQVDYFKGILEELDRREGYSFLFWTLFDFEHAPVDVFGIKPWIRATQKKFGVYSKNGKLKKAGSFLKNPEYTLNKLFIDRLNPFYITLLLIIFVVLLFWYIRRKKA